MLTKRTKYGLKALVYIARQEGEDLIKSSQIAVSESLSPKFLENIMVSLRKSGILGSKKGQNGGYYLRKKPSEIEMVDVIRILEGPISLVPCVSLNYYEKCDDCQDEQTCRVHHLMAKLRDSSLSVLQSNTLADVAGLTPR